MDRNGSTQTDLQRCFGHEIASLSAIKTILAALVFVPIYNLIARQSGLTI